MNTASRHIQRVYITLLLLNTLAASLIWGINTLFLLDAGLSNLEAFAANAFFTAGMVLFEIPTGVIADTTGRRASYLLGTITLAVSTAVYLAAWQMSAPFWVWAVASTLLGLGFSFFSGSVEAWLVDALKASGFTGGLESVFAKGQIAMGAAMLGGSVLGGLIAQATSVGVPYMVRTGILLLAFVVAFFVMKDIGFAPQRSEGVAKEVKKILKNSVTFGLRNPPVRWIMLTAPFTGGVMLYAFYAMQPYLLQLYGRSDAYLVAGLAASIFACAQIAGGMLAPFIARHFRRRTTILMAGVIVTASLLFLVGSWSNFWSALVLMVLWSLVFAAVLPVRQTYLNGMIPSQQRATVLSFDKLLESSGGVAVQPVLGRTADLWGYPASFMLGAVIQAAAIPFALLAKRQSGPGDTIEK